MEGYLSNKLEINELRKYFALSLNCVIFNNFILSVKKNSGISWLIFFSKFGL